MATNKAEVDTKRTQMASSLHYNSKIEAKKQKTDATQQQT